MTDLNIQTVFEDIVKNHIKSHKFYGIHVWGDEEITFVLLVYDVCLILTLSDSDPHNVDSCNELTSYTSYSFEDEVKIVNCKNKIYILDSKGFLKYFTGTCYSLVDRQNLSLFNTAEDREILGMTEHEGNLLNISIDRNKNEIYIRNDIFNTTTRVLSSKNLHRSTIFPEGEGVVVPFFINGNHAMAIHSENSTFLNFSDGKVISVIQIKSWNCQLICFENGKLLASYTHDKSSCCVFLTENIKCIEKCFCSDTCLLWSDGVNFHHTELIFSEEQITLKHFEIKHNIIGIIAFARFSNFIIAVTINNTYYHITPDHVNSKKEMIQNPGEILSKIYNKSLKIGEFQKNLTGASEYLNFKDVIQSDQDKIRLDWEGNFLTIKNTLGVTFSKEFWKIELVLTNQKCEYAKVVDLDTDLLKEMTIKVQNPFDNVGRVKVYLVGEFEWEILHFYVGMVGEDVDFRKENLKKMLNEINRKRNPNFVKI